MEGFNDLTKKVDKILFYLESDERTKQEGLIERVTRIDKQLESLLTREKVYLAKFSALAFLGGALFQVFWATIQKLFTHR